MEKEVGRQMKIVGGLMHNTEVLEDFIFERYRKKTGEF